MNTSGSELMKQKLLCDHIMQHAAAHMEKQVQASASMIIDRILTFGIIQMVSNIGNDSTATMLRVLADKIEDGEFDQFVTTKGDA